MSTSRRTFLQTAAASTAAVALASRAGVSARQAGRAFVPNKTPLKLGLMTYQIGMSWALGTVSKNCVES